MQSHDLNKDSIVILGVNWIGKSDLRISRFHSKIAPIFSFFFPHHFIASSLDVKMFGPFLQSIFCQHQTL